MASEVETTCTVEIGNTGGTGTTTPHGIATPGSRTVGTASSTIKRKSREPHSVLEEPFVGSKTCIVHVNFGATVHSSPIATSIGRTSPVRSLQLDLER